MKDILRKYEIHNEEALNDYIKLVSNPYQGEEYSEVHHICPKSMFPEYRLDKWNLVRLKFEDHVEAHRLLCLIFNNGECKRAYAFISRGSYDDKVKALTKDAFAGDNNPAKREEVRLKIAENKTGKARTDMSGKKYFGADEDTIRKGLDSMAEKLKNTVIVKDKEGNRFRVSCDDPRYVSGELVSFNAGEKRENSASKRPEVMSKIMSKRNETYAKFASFTFDEMVNFLVEAHNSGKEIFGKKKPFAKNYSGYCKRTPFDQNELKDAVVQRLSKG